MYVRTHLLTAILSELDPSHHLLIDEVSPHRVIGRVVPRSKNLFPEEESPRSVPLLGPQFLGILLTLGDCIHHVITSTTERRHL